MRGVALVASPSRMASVSQASTRAAGGCSSSGRGAQPAPSHWQQRRRLNDDKRTRLSVVSLPPLAAAADGAFAGGDEEEIEDPFGPADAALPPEVAAQMATAIGVGGDSDGDVDGGELEFATASTSASEFESGGGQVRPFSRIGEKDPYR